MTDQTKWEEDALDVYMFDGDFGSPYDRTLKDKIVTARKGGTCDHCLGEVQPKTRIRAAAYIFDGTLMSYRWCHDCTDAMAKSWDDEGEALEKRFKLRYERNEPTNQKAVG